VFESIKLTGDQVECQGAAGPDWMRLTADQYELIRTCGADRRCAFIGDELVRMPLDQFERMLSAGFKAAAHSAIKSLGLSNADEIKDIDMNPYELGATHLSVTVTSTDGRKASGLGQLVLPSIAH